jgi:hypothetical protein
VRARALLVGCLLLASVAMAPAKQTANNAPAVGEVKEECVPASKAATLVGRYGCVAGRVFRVTEAKSGNQHLSFCPPRAECSFHVAVPKADRKKVGDLSYLRNKLVAVVGDVVEFRGRPRMVVHDKEQLHVTAGNPPGELDAGRSRAAGRTTGDHHGRAW